MAIQDMEFINDLKWEKWLHVILLEFLTRCSEICPEISYSYIYSEDNFRRAVIVSFGYEWCCEFKLKSEEMQRQSLSDNKLDKINNSYLHIVKILSVLKKRRFDAIPIEKEGFYNFAPLSSGGTRGYGSRNHDRHK